MIELEDLNEVEQKAVMYEYINGTDTPILNEQEIFIPSQLMVAYRCHTCKQMKYVRIHTIDIRSIAQTINCNCDRKTYMRIRTYGAGNIALLTSKEVVKPIFTLDDFF